MDGLLWIGAAICFGCAAAGVPFGRVNAVGLGLFLATLTVLV